MPQGHYEGYRRAVAKGTGIPGPGDEGIKKVIAKPKRSGKSARRKRSAEAPDPTDPTDPAPTGALAEAGGPDATGTKPQEQPQELTEAEINVLRLVAAGLTNKQVAAELNRSVYTVE